MRYASMLLLGLLAVALATLTQGRATTASHDSVTAATPGEDVGFDMITTLNAANALGPIDPCVEVAPGSSVTFDAFLDGIPLGRSLSGFNFAVGGPPGEPLTGLGVTSIHDLQPGVSILTAQFLGFALWFTTHPPAPLEGYFVGPADLGPAETNPPTVRGVLARFDVSTNAGPDSVPGNADDTPAAAGYYKLMMAPLLGVFDSAGREIIDAGDQFSDGEDGDGDTLADEDSVIDWARGYGIIAVGAGCGGILDSDGDTVVDDNDPDDDNDGIADGADNCRIAPNPGQENNVHPGTPAGDHCDDPEPDGVYDIADNCPDAANAGQEDLDGDAMGDACDGDDDGDGYWDADEALKGSSLLDAGSWPEHCDGVDNDGDTQVDETPNGGIWDRDRDTVKDCLDTSVDTDGDGVVNTADADDDGDGRTDAQERSLSTDELGECSPDTGHDGWAPDRDRDKDADIGDVIGNFNGTISAPASYDARSDSDGDGDVDIGDVIQMYGSGKINTKCAAFTFLNNTGGPLDDIHIVWSQPIAEVYVARDSALAGWSERSLSGDGLTLDMRRPDASGDLAAGGTLTVVVRTASPMLPAASLCRWALEGVDVGGC